MPIRRTLALVVLILLWLPATDAIAQDPESPPQGTRERLEDLIATIEEPEQRERLLTRLRALLEATAPAEEAPAEPPGALAGVLALVDDLTEQVRATLANVVRQGAGVPDRVRAFANGMKVAEYRGRVIRGLLLLAVLVVLALLLSAGVRRGLRWPVEKLRSPPAAGALRPWSRCWRLLLLSLVELAPALVLVAAGFLGLSIRTPAPPLDALVLLMIWALAVRRAAQVAIEVFTSSSAPALRLVPLSDDRAVRLTRSLGRIASVAVYGLSLIRATAVLGADAELLDAARGFYGLLLLLMGVVLVLRYRGPTRSWLLERRRAIRGAAEGDRASFFGTFLVTAAGLWWIVALLYMLALYMTWASGLTGGLEFLLRATAITAAILVATVAAVSLVAVAVGRLQRSTETALSAYPQLRGRVGGYFSVFRTVLTVILVAFAVSLAFEAWGIAALDLLQSATVLALLTAAVRLLVIIFLAAAVLDLATIFTQRYLTSREESGRATAKVKTLVPLVRSIVKIVVIVVAAIMVLSEVGVEIGPILAGVGVLGLAVGFGAQTLVKDIITGFFILVEDSISVGDVAVLAGQGGLVERVNLRTVRLRDLSGNVHIIPYSAVSAITNMTREFSFYLVEAGVSYREDTDEVVEVLRAVLEEMRNDAEWMRDILEPLEVLGVDRFTDSAVIVRARIKTKPIRQWAVGREFNRRMKKAFDERGIEIPFPHRTIYMGEPKRGDAPSLHVRLAEELERREGVTAGE